MLGGVRSVLSPFLSAPCHPRALSLSSRSLPSIHSFLFVSLSRSFPLASLRLFRGGASPSLSFFLLGPAPSFSSVASSSVPFRPHHPAARSPRGFPLSSLLMPRDRQMMIKKAPVRVRTTPRRPVPPPASLLVLHHLLLLLLLHPPSPPPTILLPLFLSRFSPLHFSAPPPPRRSRALSPFFPSLDFRSFVPSFLVCSSSLLPSPETFFPSPRAFPLLRLHVCRVHRSARRMPPSGLPAICY